MVTVTVSPKYQVVLIPVRPIAEARGALKGIDTVVLREDEDR